MRVSALVKIAMWGSISDGFIRLATAKCDHHAVGARPSASQSVTEQRMKEEAETLTNY